MDITPFRCRPPSGRGLAGVTRRLGLEPLQRLQPKLFVRQVSTCVFANAVIAPSKSFNGTLFCEKAELRACRRVRHGPRNLSVAPKSVRKAHYVVRPKMPV